MTDEREPATLLHDLGIGRRRSAALREAGYETAADVEVASVEELVRVDGIDRPLARDIKRAFEDRDYGRKKRLWRDENDSWDHGDYDDRI